ncbi:hypothetical protein KSX_74780 [Ktedonospora formicarum]|uniref:Response regulatory domain-containing protein n=2 Tax=Ktedonospora formicarum TaxID=2778364 RepID=A0A8J3MVG7_9CHLR|nr:hypothetical protein KSX_74780 [Ktedonospora formicarum]
MPQLIPELIETVIEPVAQTYCEQQITVLLVEDDPDIRIVMTETLKDEGYQVLVARDGEEGLKTFQAHAEIIQLVIADIMMPKMQGRAFQEQVRQSHPLVKILVMSGHHRLQLQRQNLLDPHSSFLQKPFDLDVFCETVQKLLASPQ